ncbi:outer dense fiber protein 3-like protein 2b [Astyanax mexicanus]|uniref:outer dense fiber protein 3-like protein 2b n=1 Tax=Astyanax mexicanus TaxID=7994 RepID=UPI0020CAC152|nr:outer dense fiber protein 3-like protein 2b [Astyanax mexicanus]
MSETEKKRPIIAGREKGPGPGRYALPSTIGFVGHDFTKATSPAYTFHGKMSENMYNIDSSPGPRYNIDAKVTRFGRDGSPAYSIYGRTPGPKEMFQTPGPGAYNPEIAPVCSTQRKPPSYTMGYRTPYCSGDTVPAPNKYTLPALMGSSVLTKPASASYTISGRFKFGSYAEDLSNTPGPGRYNRPDPNVYLPRQPAFSMLGRHDGKPSETMPRPGPGSHNPENVTTHKPRAPAFTLGIRHSDFVTPLVVHLLD